MRATCTTSVLCILVICAGGWVNEIAAAQSGQFRNEISLDGEWQVSLDAETTWHRIRVPGTVEDQIDISFDGIAIYTKSIDPIPLDDARRLLLHFDAVATHATVLFNGIQVGEHLGGWTPFRFDVTAAAKANPHKTWDIKVICDERAGHNTQGFLPVFAPHFSGIWQSAKLIEVPDLTIDDLALGVFGILDDRTIDVRYRVQLPTPTDEIAITYQIRDCNKNNWHASRI